MCYGLNCITLKFYVEVLTFKMIVFGDRARVPAKSPQVCSTLCDLMDCSPPGSSVHGVLQARILEWVAMPSSREHS